MSEFHATHEAPEGGLRAWAAPDPSQQPITTVQARVEMQVLELRGDWAHIECSNGWSAWVDARRLVTKHAPPPAPPAAPAAAPSGPPPGPTGPPTAAAAPSRAATSSGNGFADFLARPVMDLGGRSLIVQDLIPAGGIFLGALLGWVRKGAGNSFDVPLLFLFDYKTSSTALKLGWILLIAAGVLLAPVEKRFHLIALSVTVGAGLLYLLQAQRLVSDLGAGISVTDFIGLGVVVTIAAAGVGLYWSLRKTS
jgi:hypothetical protein